MLYVSCGKSTKSAYANTSFQHESLSPRYIPPVVALSNLCQITSKLWKTIRICCQYLEKQAVLLQEENKLLKSDAVFLIHRAFLWGPMHYGATILFCVPEPVSPGILPEHTSMIGEKATSSLNVDHIQSRCRRDAIWINSRLSVLKQVLYEVSSLA